MPSAYDDDLWELVGDDPGPVDERLVEFVRSLGPVADALDLGCGDGRLSAAIACERLTLADVSDVALARAARRMSASGAASGPRPVATVALTPDAPLPLADNAFDLVLCAETVEHVRDLQLLLSECRRVLRPGGRLAVTTPAHSRTTGLRILVGGFERVFPPLSPHLRFFTRRSLRALLGELGFAVERLERRGSTLLAVARR